jgi:hypothetical protein
MDGVVMTYNRLIQAQNPPFSGTRSRHAAGAGAATGEDGAGNDDLPDYTPRMSFPQFIGRLSRHVFWDTDPASIDPERHENFVIARVMDRGTLDDVRAAWDFYGAERVQTALLQAPSLGAKTISFFANQFDLPREAFRAFRHRDAHWTS